MKQYCRYCAHALEYDGSMICDASAPCGNNSSGASYPIEKAKRLNKCKHFEFNPNDLLGQFSNGRFRQYQPRNKTKKTQTLESKQIEMEEVR
jgi:hypothetical protein